MTEQMGLTQFSWERERMLEALDAYRRGLCEPPIIPKWTAAPGAGEAPANIPGEYEKSGGSDGLPDATAMTFVISTTRSTATETLSPPAVGNWIPTKITRSSCGPTTTPGRSSARRRMFGPSRIR